MPTAITVPRPLFPGSPSSQGNNTSSPGPLKGDMASGTAWGSVRVGHLPASSCTRQEGSVVSTGRARPLSQALCLPPFKRGVCHSGLGPGLWARPVSAPLDIVTRWVRAGQLPAEDSSPLAQALSSGCHRLLSCLASPRGPRGTGTIPAPEEAPDMPQVPPQPQVITAAALQPYRASQIYSLR